MKFKFSFVSRARSAIKRFAHRVFAPLFAGEGGLIPQQLAQNLVPRRLVESTIAPKDPPPLPCGWYEEF